MKEKKERERKIRGGRDTITKKRNRKVRRGKGHKNKTSHKLYEIQ